MVGRAPVVPVGPSDRCVACQRRGTALEVQLVERHQLKLCVNYLDCLRTFGRVR